MKKVSFIVAAGLAVLSFQACNDGATTDAVESANESNEIKLDSAERNDAAAAMPVDEVDTKFAVNAASGGMMEVQLGELAQQKASSQRVKDFGAMMVRDHSKANDELKSLAGMKNVTLPPAPGEDHMDHIRELTKKSGRDFDREYMKMTVDDHEDDIEDFEKAANNAKDADVRAFAAKTLPVLRMHLDSAKAIRDAQK